MLKRITDEQCEEAVKAWVWEHLISVITDRQLQADLKAIEKCKPEIRDMLSDWRTTIINNISATSSFELADRIIKLLNGEE